VISLPTVETATGASNSNCVITESVAGPTEGFAHDVREECCPETASVVSRVNGRWSAFQRPVKPAMVCGDVYVPNTPLPNSPYWL
jgi:hypothetical protein